MYKKSIDYTICNSCMKCVEICTNSQVIVRNDQGRPEFKDVLKCINCGHCYAICPQNAIKLEIEANKVAQENMYYAKPYEISKEKAVNDGIMLDVINSIRSTRHFLKKEIEKDKLLKILDSMTRAPTAGNEQNKNFYILNDESKIDNLEKMLRNFYDNLQIKNPLLIRLIALIYTLNTRKNTNDQCFLQLSFKKQYNYP